MLGAICNWAICNCAGKNEEVTGSLMLSLIIETWTILQQFLPPEVYLCYCLQVADCQEVYNRQFEHHRAAFLLAVVHLQHLVQALLVRAPDRQMRAFKVLRIGSQLPLSTHVSSGTETRSTSTCIFGTALPVCMVTALKMSRYKSA